jgi:TIR domain
MTWRALDPTPQISGFWKLKLTDWARGWSGARDGAEPRAAYNQHHGSKSLLFATSSFVESCRYRATQTKIVLPEGWRAGLAASHQGEWAAGYLRGTQFDNITLELHAHSLTGDGMPVENFFLFVSHVTEDRVAALQVVDELERRGIRCWITPRDVGAGKAYDDEIADAIDGSRALLLIFSEHCNSNEYIRREITVAGNAHKLIIPFRIENAEPKKGLAVRLADLHWIDGFVARERAIDEVLRTVQPPKNQHDAASSAPDRATPDPVIPVNPVPTPPMPPPIPRADPVPGHSAGNKVAAVCIWIVCAVMAVVALTAGGITQDQLHACIGAGGSGGGCSSGTIWSKAVLVLAFLGAGLGGRYWMRR